MSINVLFIATAENRKFKMVNLYDDLPELIDENGNIFDNYTSDLDNFKSEYFEIITSLYSDNIILKYITIDPNYSEDKVNDEDDPRYIEHISKLLEEIDLEKYYNFFDSIFIASAYNDMFNIKNINIISKLLKPESYLITTYPSGFDNLILSNYKFIKIYNNKNIFKK